MSFGMITLNQKYHYNVKDVYEDISNDAKKDFKNQIMKSVDHYQKVKIKKWLD